MLTTSAPSQSIVQTRSLGHQHTALSDVDQLLLKSDIVLAKSRQGESESSENAFNERLAVASASADPCTGGGQSSAFGSSNRSHYGINDPLLVKGSTQGRLVIHEVEEDKFASHSI